MNHSYWTKLIALTTILIMPFYASGDGFIDGMRQGTNAGNEMIYGGQQQAEALKRQQQGNEMARQQIEQQRLETQRRTDEYNR